MIDRFCRSHITVAITASCKVVTRSSQLHRSHGVVAVAVTPQLHHSHNCEQRLRNIDIILQRFDTIRRVTGRTFSLLIPVTIPKGSFQDQAEKHSQCGSWLTNSPAKQLLHKRDKAVLDVNSSPPPWRKA